MSRVRPPSPAFREWLIVTRRWAVFVDRVCGSGARKTKTIYVAGGSIQGQACCTVVQGRFAVRGHTNGTDTRVAGKNANDRLRCAVDAWAGAAGARVFAEALEQRVMLD